MSKFLNKYVRKTHRWLALLTVALIITVLLARNTAVGFAAQQIQQVLMLIMALTGLYLFLLPWWTKWMRNKRRNQ